MTNDQKPMPPGGPQQAWRELKAENDAEHVEHIVEFINGPAKGQTFSIPDGVMVLDVEVDGKPYKYLRSARADNTFAVSGE